MLLVKDGCDRECDQCYEVRQLCASVKTDGTFSSGMADMDDVLWLRMPWIDSGSVIDKYPCSRHLANLPSRRQVVRFHGKLVELRFWLANTLVIIGGVADV